MRASGPPHNSNYQKWPSSIPRPVRAMRICCDLLVRGRGVPGFAVESQVAGPGGYPGSVHRGGGFLGSRRGVSSASRRGVSSPAPPPPAPPRLTVPKPKPPRAACPSAGRRKWPRSPALQFSHYFRPRADALRARQLAVASTVERAAHVARGRDGDGPCPCRSRRPCPH